MDTLSISDAQRILSETLPEHLKVVTAKSSFHSDSKNVPTEPGSRRKTYQALHGFALPTGIPSIDNELYFHHRDIFQTEGKEDEEKSRDSLCGLLPKEGMEIISSNSTFSREILYGIIIRAILPYDHDGIYIGGEGVGVVYFDLEQKLDISRIQHLLATSLEFSYSSDPEIDWKNSNIVTEALARLSVITTSSTCGLAQSLFYLERMVVKPKPFFDKAVEQDHQGPDLEITKDSLFHKSARLKSIVRKKKDHKGPFLSVKKEYDPQVRLVVFSDYTEFYWQSQFTRDEFYKNGFPTKLMSILQGSHGVSVILTRPLMSSSQLKQFSQSISSGKKMSPISKKFSRLTQTQLLVDTSFVVPKDMLKKAGATFDSFIECLKKQEEEKSLEVGTAVLFSQERSSGKRSFVIVDSKNGAIFGIL